LWLAFGGMRGIAPRASICAELHQRLSFCPSERSRNRECPSSAGLPCSPRLDLPHERYRVQAHIAALTALKSELESMLSDNAHALIDTLAGQPGERSGNAREQSPGVQTNYFPMLQVVALLVLDVIAGIVTTLWIRVWWAVGGTSGVE
jgi:hypothetical protein